MTEIITETDLFSVWLDTGDASPTFHLDLYGVTIHFFAEDFEEFARLMRQYEAAKAARVEAGTWVQNK